MVEGQPDQEPTYHITTPDDFAEKEREHRIKHELIVENLLLSILQELLTQNRGVMSSDEYASQRGLDEKRRLDSIFRHNELMNDRRRLNIAIKSYLERTSGGVAPDARPEKADDLED